MLLTLVEIKEFSKKGSGISNFVGNVSNGYLYVFTDSNGIEYTKYSFEIWSNITKYRTSISSEQIENLQYYIDNDPNMVSAMNRIPFEGDIYDFDFKHELNEYNQNKIVRISKPKSKS